MYDTIPEKMMPTELYSTLYQWPQFAPQEQLSIPIAATWQLSICEENVEGIVKKDLECDANATRQADVETQIAVMLQYQSYCAGHSTLSQSQSRKRSSLISSTNRVGMLFVLWSAETMLIRCENLLSSRFESFSTFSRRNSSTQ